MNGGINTTKPTWNMSSPDIEYLSLFFQFIVFIKFTVGEHHSLRTNLFALFKAYYASLTSFSIPALNLLE